MLRASIRVTITAMLLTLLTLVPADARGEETAADVDGTQSLARAFGSLDLVDEYHRPGYCADSPGDPLEQVQRLFSNRRVAKVYTELKALPAAEQKRLLESHITSYLEQYREILAKFRVDAPAPRQEDYLDLARISDVEGMPTTLTGTRHALQSLVVIAGMLGSVETWPAIESAFANPLLGYSADESAYRPELMQTLRLTPVFPEEIRAQAAFLMASNIDDERAAASGFNRRGVLDLVGRWEAEAAGAAAGPRTVTRELRLPAHTTAAGPYDPDVRAVIQQPEENATAATMTVFSSWDRDQMADLAAAAAS